MYADKNPKTVAVGAYWKTTGQSSAGFELGINFSEIPTNAGIISPKNILTPVIIIYKAAVNVNDWNNGKINQFTLPERHAIEMGVNHMWTVSMLQMHKKAILVIDEDAALDLRLKTYKYFKDIEAKNLNLENLKKLILGGN